MPLAAEDLTAQTDEQLGQSMAATQERRRTMVPSARAHRARQLLRTAESDTTNMVVLLEHVQNLRHGRSH